jgi:hypothetical protein
MAATIEQPNAETAAANHAQRPRRRGRWVHGHYLVQQAVERALELGQALVDPTTQAGVTLAEQRQAFIDAKGGDPSPQQIAIIDEVMRLNLLIAHIDRYLIELRDGIVNRRHKRLAPIVEQRQKLADSRLRHLQALGLERRARRVSDVLGVLDDE